jgi:hypothetical protein
MAEAIWQRSPKRRGAQLKVDYLPRLVKPDALSTVGCTMAWRKFGALKYLEELSLDELVTIVACRFGLIRYLSGARQVITADGFDQCADRRLIEAVLDMMAESCE